MEIHQEWMTNNTLFGDDFTKNIQTQEAKDRFDIQRYQSNEGFAVKVDGIAEQVAIQIHVSPLSADREMVKIVSSLQCNIKTGSVIEWDGKTSIVVSKMNETTAYKYANMSESNNSLLFYPPTNPNENTLLCDVPAIVGKGNISLSVDKFVSLASDEYLITCTNNIDSSKIDESNRFILGAKVYKILGIDDIGTLGLLEIKVKEDVFCEDDNRELGIANYYSNQTVYTMQLISNPIVNLLFTNETSNIVLKCFANGIEDLTPILSITNDNVNVSTINNSTLTITCVGTGVSNIGISYHNTITDIVVNGTIEVTPNYALAISGVSSIKISQQSTYNAIVTNNGASAMRNVIWGLFADDGVSSTTLASITSTSGTFGETIIVKANSSSTYGYVRLKSHTDINSCSNELRIQIKSLI